MALLGHRRLHAKFPRARCTQYSEVNFWAERNFVHRVTSGPISPKGQNFCIDNKRPSLRALPGLHTDVKVVD